MLEATQASAEAEDTRLVGADRVLGVLLELARHPAGVGLDDLARAVSSPKPTVHRALGSLRRAGLAAQDGRGRYLLGDEFLRIAFTHHEARPDHTRVLGRLQQLCDRYGETTHFAVLDGRSVVYRAKIDPAAGAMRLTSTIGGRNPAHCTAVGKVLLAQALPDNDAVRAWVARAPLEQRTSRTKVTARALCAELALVRAQGYAVEDQENEPGVNCLALPVFLTSPTVPSGAISISGLVHRTPVAALLQDLDAIRAIVGVG